MSILATAIALSKACETSRLLAPARLAMQFEDDRVIMFIKVLNEVHSVNIDIKKMSPNEFNVVLDEMSKRILDVFVKYDH